MDDWTLDLVLTVVIGMRILRCCLHVVFWPSLCGERVLLAKLYLLALFRLADFPFRMVR